uniref:Uncharacterized protein n=1 Tax=Candidatus Kentrum sp. TUN TaxID=2126343 RepID=A0A450ZSG2_9GAMM|nr:MAG: hypothetical protein BECKTUN1418F_GA0071002_109411 [Candidatus Kentron sp. TUN]VFK65662.1 MAG: hypothetical protein BECKTUN1418E_GA0071001_11117 [Candidatus Kentron sp. TUN]
MTHPKITVRHLGRKSTFSTSATRQQIQTFLGMLLKNQFFMESDKEGMWILGRKIRLMEGDWPIKVFIQQNGTDVTISYFMFVPWSLIITFSVMIFFFLPFIPLKGVPLVFFLGLGVIAMAIYKQRLDFSPNASWQGPPRQRWNDKMIDLLANAFDGRILKS